jgi:Excalibur calcium-binding domain
MGVQAVGPGRCEWRGLTPRLTTGPATAGCLGPAWGTRHIFPTRAKPSRRIGPVNSNVMPRKPACGGASQVVVPPPRESMNTSAALIGVLAGLLLASEIQAATPVHKCVINGTVTFQSDPCPSTQPRKTPTKEELNAERKKRVQAAGPAASRPAAPPATSTAGTESSRPEPVAATQAKPREQYRCDGRQHCSQMRSCDEAKYFLANCPGTKMDGDRDGIPCEDQWCSR